MASLGLAQIDENSSLVETSGSIPVLLPSLLGRTSPEADAVGEATPEFWPKISAYGGESTPEAWPKAPTPHGRGTRPRGGPTFGDQTPESWPEAAPSFRIDAQQQQPSNVQAPMPMMFPCQGVNAIPSIVPMWPAQMWPAPMVFDGNMMSMAHASMPGTANLPGASILSHVPNNLSCAASGIPDQTYAVKTLPKDKGATKVSSSMMPKKPAAVSLDASTAGNDKCPVGVYVDLSSLRPRDIGVGSLSSGRR